jgi:hypothetical protein
MQLTRCDGCGKEVAKQGLARLQGWAGVRVSERVPHPKHSHIEQTETQQYELCDDCVPKLKALICGGKP